MNGSILIVSRNNLHLTKLAVKSALEQDVPCDVMVIDNASDDGTTAWLRSKGVFYLPLQNQESLARCWNKGLKTFWQIQKREVMVCNNDIELRSDAYSLLASMRRPFITCISVDNKAQMGIAGDRSLLHLMDTVRPHPDFSCFMINKSVTDQGLWFDESFYPAYLEDNDFHVRMHRAGIRATCVDLPFLHHGAQTIKSADAGEQARIKRGADANREKFRAQYGCLPGTPEYTKLFT